MKRGYISPIKLSTKIANERAKAFTLVEVLISFALFTVVSLGLLSSMAFSRKQAENITHDNIILTLLQGYMEQMRAIEYDALKEAATDPTRAIKLLSYREEKVGETVTPTLKSDEFLNGVVKNIDLYIDIADSTKDARSKNINIELTPTIVEIQNTNNRSLLVSLECEYEIYRGASIDARSQRVSMVVAPWD